jgi:hypothetical protein
MLSSSDEETPMPSASVSVLVKRIVMGHPVVVVAGRSHSGAGRRSPAEQGVHERVHARKVATWRGRADAPLFMA